MKNDEASLIFDSLSCARLLQAAHVSALPSQGGAGECRCTYFCTVPFEV